MGVPALFRWLSRKYPKIVQPVQENEEDMREANPNGEENDMLYLDMNGIVHPCTHPENGQAPKTEEDMMLAIFKYTERVVRMVRPRKLLFMAIDGVAPRAKMNQQRSRRFRAAQEARTKEEERQEAILEWQSRGRPVSESLINGDKAWDSNAITPGTPFMDLLAASLRYWVAQKMNTDPAWQHLHVIISDASVPGEGEHKIMDYIRRIRSAPEHDANTRHVVYGLDADLIMLSLATHEPYFKVLREDVFAQGNKPRGCHRCGQPGHHSSMCTAPPKPPEEPKDGDAVKPFIFLDVPTLREYLSHELALPHLPVPFDLERAIDDWVFLIFFVGNDFLPHLPSLEIREGAIDTLIGIWKTALGNNALDGWVTNHGAVELQRLQVVLSGLAEREDEIFRKRKEAEERQDRGEKRRRIAQGTNNRADVGDNTTQGHDFVAVHSKPAPPKSSVDTAATRTANLSAAEKLKREMMGDGDGEAEAEAKESEEPANATEEPAAPEQVSPSSSARGTKRKANDADVPEGPDDANAVEQNEVEPADGDEANDDGSSDAEEGPSVLGGLEADKVPGLGGKKPAPLKMLGDNVVEQDDSVKLWEPGYRERYYQQKFGRSLDDIEFRRSLVKSYVEGLCWVLGYYYQGCQSWQWYYPEHFSPFAADFIDVGDLDITFNIGKPFRPFEQLMGVFPADSRHHLPEPYHPLMTEPTSPIIDFYPEEFHIDMNGKKMLWQGVALLPFIDEKRLLGAMSPMTSQLTEDEARRNSPGKNHLFVHDANPLYEQVAKLYNGKPPAEPVPMDYRKSNRVLGLILPDPETVPSSTYFSPLTAVGQPDIDNDRSISAIWLFPPQRKPHKSVLLPGADQAGRILSRTDIEIVKRGGDPRHQSSRPDSFHASRRDIDGFGGRRGRGGGRGGGPMPRNDPYSGYDAGNSFQRNGGGGGRGGHNPAFNNYGYGGPQQQPAPMPNYGYGGYGGYGGAQPAPIVSNPMMGYGNNNQAFVPPGGFSNYGQYGGVPAAPAAMRGGRGRGGPPGGNAFTNQQGMGLPPHLQYLNQQQGGQQHRRF